MKRQASGVHTTDTIDFEYVISGRVVLELDDGVTTELGPGDTVVQNGPRHAWRGPGLTEYSCHPPPPARDERTGGRRRGERR